MSGWKKRRDVPPSLPTRLTAPGSPRMGDRLRAVSLFVLLAEFRQFSSAMPFVYTIIMSPLDCFLSRSCVTDAAYCGRKKPKGEINNVHSGYSTLMLNLNLVCETFRA